MRSLYLTLAASILLVAASAGASQPAPALGSSAAVFTVFSHGSPVGSLQASVDESADGWTITSSGRLGSPMGIILRRATIRYDSTWHPRELSIDATTHGEPTSVETSFANGTATERITTKGTPATSTEAVPADAIVLPNPFFGAYEALAARLAHAAPGTTLHIYAAPHVQYEARVGGSSSERLQTADRLIDARLTRITFLPTGQPPVQATVLIDPSGRLLRLDIPAQALQVVREDIASVSTRRVTVSRPNDRSVNVPDNGFSLAGTLSQPSNARGSAEKMPAIVLVAPASQTDRDGVTAGVPVIGELAGALADAGFAVLRYDNRGTGQSGGRADAATLDDYAEDARAAVKFMADRDGIDEDRVALLGYGDGGYIAMLAASKEKKIKALVLVNAPSTTGAALTLERQERALAQSHLSEADKQQRIALQKKVQQAVLTGKGWDGVPAAVRQQSDTPLFKSFLAFDPAEVMKDVRQPVLVVQGDRDEQVPPADAQQLE
ncbi:MAG TPA: alpha/beta fold hydrolase, partial [Vicinamibacterales bacterium]|nr:alpha/beta fold hydrolase [Vicinamibacterales bacterium]